MTVIFKVKTHEGYFFKVLSELLKNIIKTACLEITEAGIGLCMMDSHRHILVDVELKQSNFNMFQFSGENLYLGINLTHLFSMLKTIKKKDSLVLYIDDDEPEKLYICIHPKENNRLSKSFVYIQTIQHIKIPLPIGYSNPVIVSSGDYQRTLKDMINIGDTLTVHMRKYSISIACSADNIYSKEVMFGELDDKTDEYYCENFNMDPFNRILKISGLCKNIQVCKGTESLPLRITSNIGQLGVISFYIKSRNQIRLDSMSS